MKTENFSEYLVKLQPELLCFAFRLTADKDDANDLLQTTSLKALDNEYRFVSEINFRAWIYTVMRNVFISNYRKVLRKQIYVDTTKNLYLLNFSTENIEDPFGFSYDIRDMYKVLNSLPKDYKIPFSMYVSGFKYREISEKLNLPIGTVKSRIFLTRRKLQIIFKDFR